MSPTRPTPPVMNHVSVKPEPMDSEHKTIKTEEYEERPTDLSMDGPTDLSTSSRHVNIVCSPDTPTLRDPPAHFYATTNEENWSLW